MLIFPTAARYYYVAETDITAPIVIPAAFFTDDAGGPAVSFAGLGPNAYQNLFVNGQLVERGLYVVGPTELTLNPAGETIYAGTPLILETVSFSAQVVP